MCDQHSVENWLQGLRYSTENYDCSVHVQVDHLNDQEHEAKMQGESDAKVLKKVRALSGSYENIWNCSTRIEGAKQLHYGEVCRVSFELNETVEDLCITPIILTKIDLCIPPDILQWKLDLLYDGCSSEEEDEQEYASLEKIHEEQGQTCFNQVRPFPVEIPVEIRHYDEKKHNFRSQTMHDMPRVSFEQVDIVVDIKGVVKIISDGSSKKVAKNQVLRIYQDQMALINDKGDEDMIINSLLQTSYKSTSKKEITITRIFGEICKTYKLQFDSTKDMNLAGVDLEQYYGCERPNFIKVNNEEKSQIRYKLLKLLGKRSSKDLLEKKGIIKNEPIFGNTLKHLFEMYDQSVPAFVTKTIQLIELPTNVTSMGLYRASGNLATIQKIRFNIDKNNLKILEEFQNDIDVLTGSLKLFFRELQEPLIPHKTYEELCKYIDSEIGPKETEKIKAIVNKMEMAHKNTLLTLFRHLLVVESYSEQNKMDFYNISIVWGPTLMWPPENCHENILLNHTNANKTVELLLNIYKKTASSSPKNEASPKIGSYKENGAAIQDKTGTRNIFMQELSENLTLGLRRTVSRDNIMKSTDSLPKTPDKDFKYDLEQLCSYSKEKIPEFVLKAIPLIEKGIHSEFLYRKSVSNDKLEKIKKKISKSRCNWSTLEKYNIHELACALKHFFLELKTPLIPKDVFKRLLIASDERIEVTKIRNVKKELHNSYIPQQETLDYLLKHLVHVSRHEETNKMSKHNIAMEWTPIICRSFIENHEISSGSCIHVFDTLLQIYDNKTVIYMDLEKDSKHNNDVFNRIYLHPDSPDKQEDYLGQSPDKTSFKNLTGNPVLPPVVKRKPKIVKNDSSLYRVSRFITNTLSLYDNVQLPYVDDIKAEATILEENSLKSNKSMENSTKL